MLSFTPQIYTHTIYNKPVNPQPVSFGCRLPQKTFSNLCDIPKLMCGCCGNIMLTKSELEAFLKTFQPASSAALKSPLLSQYEGSYSFETVKNLAKKHPNLSLSKVVELPENAKAIKNLKIKIQLKINDIVHTSEKLTVKAPKVIKKFEKYRDFFSKENKELIDMLELYALKYPEKTFYEIFQKPEVYNYHKTIYKCHKEKSSLQRMNVLKKMKKLSEKLKDDDAKLLVGANTKAVEVLNNEFYQNNVRKALIEDLYENFAKACTDKKTAKEIQKAAQNYPFVRDIPDDFILEAVANNDSDARIVANIADNLKSTFEHVQAKSYDGKYVQNNGIVLCRSCNKERGNIPYPIFLKIHPEMIKNMQRQINRIIAFIKGEKLVDHDTYPLEIKKTLIEQTDKKIKLNISKFFKNKEIAARAALEKAQAAAEQNEARYKTAHSHYLEAQQRIKEALEMVNRLKKEASVYQAEANAAHNNKKNCEKILTDAKQELNKLEQMKETDRKLTSQK